MVEEGPGSASTDCLDELELQSEENQNAEYLYKIENTNQEIHEIKR